MPKVKNFAWRLERNALPTNANKNARHFWEDDTCVICGMGSEDGLHVVVRCPHARALLDMMRSDWCVPDAEQFLNNGPDWFLLLLDKLAKEDRDFLLLILWENWSDRNALTHGDASFSLKKISLFTLCSVQHPESAPLEGIRCNRKSSSRELTSGEKM